MRTPWLILPCLVLFGSPLAAETVYYASDAYFHKKRDCPKLSGSVRHQTSRESAQREGKKPCPKCVG
ncbi:MAG TPA: hypothetical protein VK188_16260 [Holophaga sp.]|nr:hypothetical protein [Holophaga sp.]